MFPDQARPGLMAVQGDRERGHAWLLSHQSPGAEDSGTVQCHPSHLGLAWKGLSAGGWSTEIRNPHPQTLPCTSAPEKHCPVICLVPPSGEGRMFSSISGFSLNTGGSRSWSEG